ncbi:GDP-mannose 4,6-dehydratase [Flavobacterium capsici]|uniref:GDP-mannose 4,6-dehydratase n=1 Tax=Flavobacterium capsici TaxID=3075618 RepID=A0AA96EYM6_9FLAO|nr:MULTISPECIES: GDP-mannose 4,6-dehydratase [unclassified Flavobacterium]WNM19673.1 GDP-mannose 4,6-dehydratase [Flavobacterium sp. PMR2A8]WNM21062.1 GDP-mannose 4,6-dehydratase [Flavobacterium sp. PMTSA4]
MKKAIITGVTGQDGAYLVKFLLEKGYKVYGTYRRSSSMNFWRLEELGVLHHENLNLIEYDLNDQSNNIRILEKIQPDEFYNLAAQSFVGVSFEQPIYTSQTTGIGALHILEAIRIVNPKIKFYQASTSEMFGKVQEIPQKESTPFYPRSPYGFSKLFAHWATINYRESYDIFGVSGILFNHESPLRGREFVTRKITDTVAKIHLNKTDKIYLGNLDAQRDWGFAKEYVEGMYKMMQYKSAETFVLATNKTNSIREFVEMSFKNIDIDIVWKGKNEDEKGYCAKTGKVLVEVDKAFYRPAEVELLIGDASKAKELLDWEAQTDLNALCKNMVEMDIKRNSNGFSF